MANNNYKPVPRVRMTLSLAIQNKVLHQLNQAFGISESWDKPHEITCYPSDFARFMALLAKMESPPTIKQLKVEYVDIRKDVLRTTVQQRHIPWNGEAPPNGEEVEKEETRKPMAVCVKGIWYPYIEDTAGESNNTMAVPVGLHGFSTEAEALQAARIRIEREA